jgi:hypothetical protein
VEAITINRKTFATTLDMNIVGEFRKTCKNLGVGMNLVIETLMREFAESNLIITMIGNKFSITTKERSLRGD